MTYDISYLEDRPGPAECAERLIRRPLSKTGCRACQTPRLIRKSCLFCKTLLHDSIAPLQTSPGSPAHSAGHPPKDRFVAPFCNLKFLKYDSYL